MIIHYDYVDKETPKAILFIRDNTMAWCPKSCVLMLDSEKMVADIKDGFVLQWKDEDGKIVLTEGVVGYRQGGGRLEKEVYPTKEIILTDEVKNDIWEYI